MVIQEKNKKVKENENLKTIEKGLKQIEVSSGDNISRKELQEVIGKIEEFYNYVNKEVNEGNTFSSGTIDFGLYTKSSTILKMLKIAKTFLDKGDKDRFKKIYGKIENKLKDFLKKFDLEKEMGVNLGASEYMKENFFLKKDEVGGVVKGKFGIYCFLIKGKTFRIFNLTSKKNGYHVGKDGFFCAGNTYEKLQEIIENQDIPAFIFSLLTIISDFDDGKQHLAKPQDFQTWQTLNEKIKLKKDCSQELGEVMKIFHEKTQEVLFEFGNGSGKVTISPSLLEYFQEKFKGIKKGFNFVLND